MKTFCSIIIILSVALNCVADNIIPVTLFHTPDKDSIPYRIPTITCTRTGRLIALTDKRWCGGDIGFGHIDVIARTSDDNGKTWSLPSMVLKGNGIKGDNACGYGDAAIVADLNSDTILVMCATGNVSYWSSNLENPLRVARAYSYDNGKTWTQPVDITNDIYGLFYARGKGNEVKSLFCGSGRIFQSHRIKVGSHYRVYTALCTHSGNFVLYSDNLGKTWNVLGGPNSECAPKGDEPKCEELPNGDVLLSSRCRHGRMFNIYHYSDYKSAKGNWDEVVNSFDCPNGIKVGKQATNGEPLIIKVKRKSDKKTTWLVLQSLPAADNRAKVTVFYKSLDSNDDYSTSKNFSSNWEGAFLVTNNTSGYSTMVLQKDGNIAFYVEENEWPENYGAGYDMNYYKLSIEDITDGKYTLAKQKFEKLPRK